jgi:hypothetical protein
MKIEKKLIACSILALAIGISSILPLTFLMSATAQAETGPEPWFSIDIPYTYWETGDGHANIENLSDEALEQIQEINETRLVSYQNILTLNVTLTADLTKHPVDAQLEYYQIDVNTDNGVLKTLYWIVGTNSNSSYNTTDLLSMENFQFMRGKWFDTHLFEITDGGGALSRQNWTSGTSVMWPMEHTGSGTIGGSGTSNTVSALREAETVGITIYRIGWATFSANTTVVTLANKEVVCQIQLEKYGEEGWLYNNLVPEGELATVDLLNPVPYEELNP